MAPRGITTAPPAGPQQVGQGACFVVVGIFVELPFLAWLVCLTVMARPWRPKTGPSKGELAARWTDCWPCA